MMSKTTQKELIEKAIGEKKESPAQAEKPTIADILSQEKKLNDNRLKVYVQEIQKLSQELNCELVAKSVVEDGLIKAHIIPVAKPLK